MYGPSGDAFSYGYNGACAGSCGGCCDGYSSDYCDEFASDCSGSIQWRVGRSSDRGCGHGKAARLGADDNLWILDQADLVDEVGRFSAWRSNCENLES